MGVPGNFRNVMTEVVVRHVLGVDVVNTHV